MAYKNSGAMKFNDATDLVIRADPDGTVESVYNLADNTEYIGLYSIVEDVTVTVTNNTSTNRTIYRVIQQNGILVATSVSITAGTTLNTNVQKNSGLRFSGSSAHWEIGSGDVDIVPGTAIIKNAAAISIEDD